MAKKEKKEKAKVEVKETVTFTNAMLERFANDQVITKLMSADLSSKVKFPLYQFSMTVLKSPAMEAYTKRKNEIVKAYTEKTDGEQGIPVDNEEILELFALKTDLTMNKLTLKVGDKLPLNTQEMIQLSWLIDFVE